MARQYSRRCLDAKLTTGAGNSPARPALCLYLAETTDGDMTIAAVVIESTSILYRRRPSINDTDMPDSTDGLVGGTGSQMRGAFPPHSLLQIPCGSESLASAVGNDVDEKVAPCSTDAGRAVNQHWGKCAPILVIPVSATAESTFFMRLISTLVFRVHQSPASQCTGSG